MPKYENIEVQLSGEDGNAFAIIGRVKHAMKRAGVPKEEIDAYVEESIGGDYNHVILTAGDWVEVT